MGIDQLKLHPVQPGYLKNLQRPTKTHAAQNRERKRGQQLSWQISSEPLHHAQPISRWKSSERDLQHRSDGQMGSRRISPQAQSRAGAVSSNKMFFLNGRSADL
ncbi:hypothetical protein F511_13748 [Dorcoceras hygrometricum]|uniref:Uncharacterized protein n=1 Tax=Dorcoceras hygrometricum TaxID=472368 RepID=A0A2Z7CJ37_9LAMI|nr:hypothetical protein F511_13748 [Dorcoceras hygrometricum]